MTAHTTHHTEPADETLTVTPSEDGSEDTPPPALTLINLPEGVSCDAQGRCSERKKGM